MKMSYRSLARAVGIPHSTLTPKMANPFKLSVEELRKIVPVLCPNPAVLLALLGYSKQQIKKFKES